MLKTTSPVISVAARRRARRRSACRPRAGGTRRSLDQPLDLLELVGAGARRAARTARSRRWSTIAPAPLHLVRGRRSRFAAVREVTASRATCTSTPRGEQVARRLRDADVGLDPADERLVAPVRGRTRRRAAAEKQVFSTGSTPSQVLRDLGHGRAEPLRVLLGDHHRHAQDRSRPATSAAALAATRVEARARQAGMPPARRRRRARHRSAVERPHAQATAPMANVRSR